MNVLVLLIFASLAIATVFLVGFIWAVCSGQYEDTCTPSMRVLMEDVASVGFREVPPSPGGECPSGARTLLPLPVRNKRGEGHSTADTAVHVYAGRPSSPQPSPPSAGGEGEEIGALNISGGEGTGEGKSNPKYFNRSETTQP
jgi:cbb3-type cytochrome oxidase maturation protein